MCFVTYVQPIILITIFVNTASYSDWGYFSVQNDKITPKEGMKALLYDCKC